jgi:MT-A70
MATGTCTPRARDLSQMTFSIIFRDARGQSLQCRQRNKCLRAIGSTSACACVECGKHRAGSHLVPKLRPHPSEIVNPEQCLLATRGKPRRRGKDIRKLIVEPRREHSRKPDEVRERIERLVDGPYLELFARETKPNWHCWGDQVGLFNRGAVATRRQPSRLIGEPFELPLRP